MDLHRIQALRQELDSLQNNAVARTQTLEAELQAERDRANRMEVKFRKLGTLLREFVVEETALQPEEASEDLLAGEEIPQQKPWTCPLCQKNFASKGWLHRHHRACVRKHR